MGLICLDMLDETNLFLKDGDEKRIPPLEKKEEAVDMLQKEITDFLVILSQKSITQETSQDIAAMMHMVNDLERVGDHCENLWRLALKKKSQKIDFSEIAMGEIEDISSKTREFLAFTVAAMERRDITIGKKSLTMEDGIDQLERSLRDNHITRLNTGECSVLSGLIFIDMLHNFEKIGDHTFNISEAITGEK
jgi:phosphate:Na+ symporter